MLDVASEAWYTIFANRTYVLFLQKRAKDVDAMERVILHSDANCFYASVESVYRPELRRVPMAVCGNPEARHGIVLTKNYLAKKCGVSTGEAI